MKDGGLVGFERIEWFNGGLFDDDTALPLTADGGRRPSRAILLSPLTDRSKISSAPPCTALRLDHAQIVTLERSFHACL
jgi:hypothetical protein